MVGMRSPLPMRRAEPIPRKETQLPGCPLPGHNRQRDNAEHTYATSLHWIWRIRRVTISAGTAVLIAIRSTCGQAGKAYAHHDPQRLAPASAARFPTPANPRTPGLGCMEGHSVLLFVRAVVESWPLLLLFPLKPRGHSLPMTKSRSCLRKTLRPPHRLLARRCTCPAARRISPGRCALSRSAIPCRDVHGVAEWILPIVRHGRTTGRTWYSRLGKKDRAHAPAGSSPRPLHVAQHSKEHERDKDGPENNLNSG